LEELSVRPKVVDKELEKMLAILVNFMGEGAIEIREKAKAMLTRLFEEDKTGKVNRLVPPSILDKIRKREMVDSLQSKIIREPSNSSTTNIKEHISPRKELAPIKKNKLSTFPKEF
jgi:hypothetical protein